MKLRVGWLKVADFALATFAHLLECDGGMSSTFYDAWKGILNKIQATKKK